MRLKLLTPTEVLLDREVYSLVAEGQNGLFALRPRHIDFVSALVPGLLYVVAEQGRDGEYFAVDCGILVKQGDTVLVSVRAAVGGVDLEQLAQTVRSRYRQLDERERAVRGAVARLEAGFLRRFMELS